VKARWIALLLLAAQGSAAQLRPQDRELVARIPDVKILELWQRHFPGRPLVPVQIQDVAKLLTYDPPAREAACAKEVEVMLKALDNYGSDAAQGKDPGDEVIQTLLELSGPCFPWVSRAYLLGSMYLMNIPSYVPEVTFFGYGQDRRLPTTIYPLLTVAALANQGRISYARENDDYYSLYECRETRIAVDLSLAPFNLAFALNHELFHVYYDKAKGGLDPDLRVFSSEYKHRDRGGVNWKVALLMEEAFALVHSGVDQILMTRVPKRFGKHGAYRLANDLNFVKVDGPLIRMIDAVGPELPETVIGKTLATQRLGTNRPEGDARAADPGLERRVEPLRKELYGNVHGGYFPGDELTAQDWALLDPGNHGAGSYLFSSVAQALPYFLQRTDPATRGVRFADYVNPGLIRPPVEGTIIQVDLRVMTAAFAGLMEVFRRDSSYCAAFTQALQSPELARYKGRGVPFPAVYGSEGAKPGAPVKLGSEGAKPGSEGVKPCLRLRGRI
jgi:hypothetical protein